MPTLYMAHLGQVQISYHFVRNLSAGCFGGNGFIFLKISGTGTVFLNGGGQMMEKILAPNESVIVESDAMFCYASTVNFDIVRVKGCMAACCGGSGIFNNRLTGPGLVVVQSLSKQKLRRALGVSFKIL